MSPKLQSHNDDDFFIAEQQEMTLIQFGFFEVIDHLK